MINNHPRKIAIIIAGIVTGTANAHNDKALEKRIAALQKEVAELKSPIGPAIEKVKLEQQIEGPKTVRRDPQ